MSTSVIVLLVIAAYLVIVLATGIRAGIGQENDIKEYVAASGSLGLVIMYF